MSVLPTSSPQPKWLVRISEVFSPEADAILESIGARLVAKLSGGYSLIEFTDASARMTADAAVFIRWGMPVTHSWPCCPQKMEGFIEKAAQALVRKFGPAKPQTILMGALDASATNRYYKTLASNFRGRTLQLFATEGESHKTVEEQAPDAATLFCLVGKEGLFCGLCSPREANGFYPGGTKYIRQSSTETISRAGAKVAEALHYVRLYRELPVPQGHWLELGASPGGITSELLDRGYRVTAVDRAALDQRLSKAPGLQFFMRDVREFRPAAGQHYDALLSDMNGDPVEASRQVIRLSASLKKGGLVIYTLKSTGVESFIEILGLYHQVRALMEAGGLKLVAKTHLTYNRHELTLFLEKA